MKRPEVITGDITKLDVDAIVNAANSALRGGGGVDGAIHRAAGKGLLEELMKHAGCRTGEAVRTGGHNLKARYVIHAVGPVYKNGKSNEPALLRAAYENAFARAREEKSIRSIAFPAISTGIYGYPKEAAAKVAVEVMQAHAEEFDRIVVCAFDKETAEIYERLLA